ncbi:MAG: aminotransferase class V-fold PLP-dependent enzyme, partial [Clostridia bacterium]|nr:aminotransferase class V-fold PLP-dependent enzyme [Clostridia bacterium]
MPIPIYDALNKHINKKMSSFHTPGHKSFAVNENYSFFFDNMINYDLTELPDTDNLLEHNGAIKESETKASRLFGSGLSLYSTFGCTLCIQTMIKLASMRSKKIIADRSIHKSAVNAMALLDMEPVWVYPEKNGRINPQEIKRLIKTNKEAKVVYITSPNYYGLIQDIDKIADICHKNDCILLVDNAHGSHLYFTDEDLDKSLQKADLVACSLHKTLPVMTAGAVLNINNKQYIKAAAEAMRLFSGTSPSYPILVSIDLCIDYLTKQKRYFLRDIAEKVKKLKHIAKQSGLLNDSSAMLDPLRLTL